MSCAANYAWVNRSSMTFLVRQAFAKQFSTTPVALDMHVVYDVSHNIAKVRHTTLALWQTRPSDLRSEREPVLPTADSRPCMYLPPHLSWASVSVRQPFQHCLRTRSIGHSQPSPLPQPSPCTALGSNALHCAGGGAPHPR